MQASALHPATMWILFATSHLLMMCTSTARFPLSLRIYSHIASSKLDCCLTNTSQVLQYIPKTITDIDWTRLEVISAHHRPLAAYTEPISKTRLNLTTFATATGKNTRLEITLKTSNLQHEPSTNTKNDLICHHKHLIDQSSFRLNHTGHGKCRCHG